MKHFFLFYFLIISIIASANAFAISDTFNFQSCLDIGIEPELCQEKVELAEAMNRQVNQTMEILIKRMLAQGGLQRVYQKANQWNMMHTPDNTPPVGTSLYSEPCVIEGVVSRSCIKDAWMNTFSVVPSFQEDDTLYYPGFGHVQIAYYYVQQTPSTSGSNGIDEVECECVDPDAEDEDYDNEYPSGTRYGGDTNRDQYCRVEFYSTDETTLDVIKDGIVQTINITETSGNILIELNQTIATQSKIEAELNIKHVVLLKRYKWDKQGDCHTGDPGCRDERNCCCEGEWEDDCDGGADECYDCEEDKTRFVCRYQSPDQVFVFQKKLSHDIEATLYNKPADMHELEVSHINVMPQVKLTSTAFDYSLEMNKAKVNRQGSEYSLVDSFPPYNILTVERKDTLHYTAKDIKESKATSTGIEFNTPAYNIGECAFTYFYPFPHLDNTTECNMLQKGSTGLTIQTDEKSYNVGDLIKVIVESEVEGGDDVKLFISYGSTVKEKMTENGKATVDFIAQSSVNKINAEYRGDSQTSSANALPVTIHVSDKSWGDYTNFIIILLVIYGLVHLYKRYGEVLLR